MHKEMKQMEMDDTHIKSCRPILLGILLAGMLTLMIACGSNGNGNANGNANGNGQTEPDLSQGEQQEVPLFEQAVIISKNEDSWLITDYIEKSDGAYIDAYWLRISEKTVLQDSIGNDLSADEIAVGSIVEAWHTGVVMESYPAQSGAAKIVLRDEVEQTDADVPIGRGEAVQIALESSKELVYPLGVKQAALNVELGYWVVELVGTEAMDQPIERRIDASSGELLPIPVAENDAFRVYSPEPGASPEPGFTVKGEARVFEAAFSWQLEDGHSILAEGHEMADEGGPAWGSFEFTVDYTKVSQPNMMLILFVYSAKDGSQEHQLIIPLKAPEDRIQYSADRE
jgi:hypothetical protein